MSTATDERTLPSLDRAHNKWLVLSVLALGQLMVVLDTTIVNVALPSIQASLHFSSTANLQWVVTAYILTFGGFLLLGGRVADRVGRQHIFICGALVFAVASLIGGLANSSGLLIGARAVQGVGAAFMAPAALGLVMVTFADGAERDRALGVWAAIAAAGGAIGLLAGGELTTTLSWRWVMFVNVPIGMVAAGAAWHLIAESKEPRAGRFDVAGAVMVTAGLGLLVLGLVRANVWGWASSTTVVVFLVAGLLLVGFAVLQSRRTYPLVPPRLVRRPIVLAADVGMLLAGAAIFGVFFFLTLYMQTVLHYSALKTGLAYLPISAMITIGAGVAAKTLSKVGPRLLLLVGFLTGALGLALLMRISPTSDYPDVVLPSILLIGAGLGAVFVTLTSSAVAGVPRRDAGIASALVNASQQVGGSLGLAVLTAVATSRFNAIRPASPSALSDAEAFTNSCAWAFGVAAGFLILAAVSTAVLMRRRGHALDDSEAEPRIEVRP